MLLLGKTTIVYGASGSVGSAVAKAFAREGAFVILAGRQKDSLERTLNSVQEAGGKAAVITVDAMIPKEIELHLAQVVNHYGPVILMFNAISWDDVQGMSLAEMPFEDFLSPIETSLKTWFYTGNILAKHMAENGGGTISPLTCR